MHVLLLRHVHFGTLTVICVRYIVVRDRHRTIPHKQPKAQTSSKQQAQSHRERRQRAEHKAADCEMSRMPMSTERAIKAPPSEEKSDAEKSDNEKS